MATSTPLFQPSLATSVTWLEVPGDQVRVGLGEQARQLAGDLDPELVLEVGDALDHAQVCIALLFGDGREHLAGDVHPDVADTRTEGHRWRLLGARRASRTASR